MKKRTVWLDFTLRVSVIVGLLFSSTGLLAVSPVQAAQKALAVSPQVETPNSTEVKPETETSIGTPDNPDAVTPVNSAQATIGDYTKPWQPTLPAYQVDLFSGSVSWSIPIDAPAGRGGLKPNLALTYNSGSVDALQGNVNPQTAGVGLGWSLTPAYIERRRIFDDIGTPKVHVADTSDKFFLVMNGVSSELICVTPPPSGQTCQEFRTQEEKFWRIQKLIGAPNASRDAGQPTPENPEGIDWVKGEYWLITTPEGTRYRLGWSGSGKFTQPYNEVEFSAWHMFGKEIGNGEAIAPYIWRWNLDRVEDLHGNVMSFSYSVETNGYEICDLNKLLCWSGYDGNSGLGWDYGYVRGGHLEQVTYSRPNYAYTVRINAQEDARFFPAELEDLAPPFEHMVQLEHILTVPQTFWSKKVIKSIDVLAGGQLLSRYNLQQSFVAGNLKLDAVQITNGSTVLPATTFQYALSGNGQASLFPAYAQGSCAGAQNYGSKFWLSGVNNGYGGGASFNYLELGFGGGRFWNAGSGQNQNGQICDPNGDNGRYWFRYRVRHVETWAGTGPSIRTVYEYRNAADTGLDNGTWVLKDDEHQFRGHPIVRTYQYDASAGAGPVVAYQNTYYHQGNGDTVTGLCNNQSVTDQEGMEGLAYRTASYDTNGTPLGRSETVHDFHAYGSDRRYIVPRTTCAYPAPGSTTASQRAEYEYDFTYGNLLRTSQYDRVDAATPYRTTTTEYTPANTGAWITNRPWRVRTFAGSANTVETGRTENCYDRDAQNAPRCGNVAPLKGDLTLTRQYTTTSALIDVMQNWYDEWGNITRKVDALNHAITMTYDTGFHQFPLQVCNSLGCAGTEYYGINGVALDGGQFGQVRRNWDANGQSAAMRYVYDAVGRIVKVIKPGDTVDLPTLQYNYADGTMPFKVESVQRWESNCLTCTLTSATFYDGLGRVLGTKTESANSNRAIVTDNRYDAFGRLARQSQPYFLSRTSASLGKYTSALLADFEQGVDTRGRLVSGNGLRAEGPFAWDNLFGDNFNYWDAYSDGDGQNEYVDYVFDFAPQDWRDYDTLRLKFYTWCDGGCTGNRKIRLYIHDQDGTGNSDGNGYHYLGDWTDGALTLNFAGANNRDQIDRVLIRVHESFFSGLTVANARQRTHVYNLEIGNSETNALAWTKTTYSAAGQVTHIVGPDNAVVSTGQVVNQTTVADANQHYQVTQVDSFGRVIQVHELAGNVAVTATATASSSYNSSTPPSKAIDGNLITEWVSAGQLNGAWIQLDWNTPVTLSAVVLRERVNLVDTINAGRLYFSDGTNVVVGRLPNEGGPTAVLFEPKRVTWVRFVAETAGGSNAGLMEMAAIPERYTTSYTYNTLDQLVRVTDALTHTTVITYNLLGQKVAMLDPDMGNWQYTYNLVGGLQSQTDAQGQRVLFDYDALNRPTAKRSLTGSLATYGYDEGGAAANALGRRTSMTDPSGSTKWNYDVRGRVTSEIKSITGVGTYTTTYTYNTADQLKTITYPTGETVQQTYNNVGQLSTVAGLNTYGSNFVYDAVGRLTQMSLGNSLTTAYSYYPWSTQGGRLKIIQTGAVQNLQYQYDPVGNVRTIADQTTGFPTSGEVLTYTYDALDRLTGVTGAYTQTYAYNAIGNLLNKNGAPYTYGDPQHSHAVTRAGNDTYTYDLNGNMTRRVEGNAPFTQTFDVENRLTAVDSISGTTRFVYDGNGARVLQIKPDGSQTAYVGNYLEVEVRSSIAAPTNLSATVASSAQINLFWTDNSDNESGFRIERSPAGTGSWVEVATVGANVTVFADTGVSCGTGYAYRVRAYHATGNSPYSNESSAVLPVCTPPNAPSGLSATAAGSDRITLAWTDNSNNESGFKIERSPNGIDSWTEIAAVGANVVIFANTGLTSNTTYYYRVRAYSTTGNSSYSNTASATTTCVTAPTGLIQMGTNSYVQLRWNDNNSNESGFKIERSEGSNKWVQIATVGANVTSYRDTSAACYISYSYRVRAYSGCGDSGYSNVVSIYLDCGGTGRLPDRQPYEYARAGNNLVAQLPAGDSAGGKKACAMHVSSPRMVSAAQSKDTTSQVGALALGEPPSGQTWKSYYRAGGQLIAMRVQGDPNSSNNGLFYLHRDHLGSTSLVTSITGTVLSRQSYLPYGEVRQNKAVGTVPTTIGYTGQRLDWGTGGLMYYNARYYSPALGRFISADTIVPEKKDPQKLNRYAYTDNNPIRYIDPTGHFTDEQIFQMTQHDAAWWKSSSQETYDLLRAIGLGDKIYFYPERSIFDWMGKRDSVEIPFPSIGTVDLDKNGKLGISFKASFCTFDLLSRLDGLDAGRATVYRQNIWRGGKRQGSELVYDHGKYVNGWGPTIYTTEWTTSPDRDYMGIVFGAYITQGFNWLVGAFAGEMISNNIHGPGWKGGQRVINSMYSNGEIQQVILEDNNILHNLTGTEEEPLWLTPFFPDEYDFTTTGGLIC